MPLAEGDIVPAPAEFDFLHNNMELPIGSATDINAGNLGGKSIKNNDVTLSFVNASDIILGESELDSFMVGFRLGARLILDTFVNNDTPYEDFLKEESE